jgi:hypothetical protein
MRWITLCCRSSVEVGNGNSADPRSKSSEDWDRPGGTLDQTKNSCKTIPRDALGTKLNSLATCRQASKHHDVTEIRANRFKRRGIRQCREFLKTFAWCGRDFHSREQLRQGKRGKTSRTEILKTRHTLRNVRKHKDLWETGNVGSLSRSWGTTTLDSAGDRRSNPKPKNTFINPSCTGFVASRIARMSPTGSFTVGDARKRLEMCDRASKT